MGEGRRKLDGLAWEKGVGRSDKSQSISNLHVDWVVAHMSDNTSYEHHDPQQMQGIKSCDLDTAS